MAHSHQASTVLPAESLSQWTLTDPTSAHLHQIHGYARAGQNEETPIHFLHGNGFSALTLSGVAAGFPTTHSLILTDVPGHGGSDQPKHRMPDWQGMAASVTASLKQQLQAQNQSAAIGVGHSLGGVITLLAAARSPELFQRIILLDPVLFSPEIILAQQVMRATGVWKRSALVRSVSRRRNRWPDAEAMLAELSQKSLYKDWHPEVLQAFVDSASKDVDGERQLCCDPRWEGAIFGSYPRGLWHAVRSVKVPVDILVAENSYGFIAKSARRAARVNRHIQWHSFGRTHCFPMEQPQQTAEKIQQLLAQ
ncbi:alpha/beta fold hydrolase [Bacterioplanoides sp.]|uniref:alpha/beta fold hydrolase n=1 Tax=Bacterioplanoides sp. TaxID=2066072 RepID=UPI003AFFB002